MVRTTENQTGSPASPELPIWENEDALLRQTLRAQKLLSGSNEEIKARGFHLLTKPLDAVRDELERRKAAGEVLPPFLVQHRAFLTTLRNQALEKTGLKKKGLTEFPVPQKRHSAKTKTGLLTSLFNTAAKATRDHVVPFLQNTALPALESGARQGLALTVKAAVKAARFTKDHLGPHAKDMIGNIEDEIENAKDQLGDIVRDEILDPIENFRARLTSAPKRAAAVGILSAAFVGATAYTILHEDEAVASVSPTLASSTYPSTPFRYSSGSIRQPEQKKFVYFHPEAYKEKTPKSSSPSIKSAPSTGLNEHILKAIEITSEQGVSAEYTATLIAIESGGNPKAYNKDSKAGGLYQFIPSTAKRHDLGLKERFDVKSSSEAFADLTNSNREILRNALHRKPSKAELYLAHQQGAAGAIALILHPKERAVDALYPVYLRSCKNEDDARNKALIAVTRNGGSANMTSAQFAQLWKNQYKYRAGKIAALMSPDPS